jgi:hypothetical protein
VEHIYTLLISEFKAVVPSLTLQIVQRSAGQPQDLQSVLVKEAAYCALGLGAYHLFDYCDFDSMLINHLVPEAHSTNPQYVNSSFFYYFFLLSLRFALIFLYNDLATSLFGEE